MRKTGERLYPFSGGEVPGPLVPVADDHWKRIAGSMRYVKRNLQEGEGAGP